MSQTFDDSLFAIGKEPIDFTIKYLMYDIVRDTLPQGVFLGLFTEQIRWMVTCAYVGPLKQD